MTTIVELQIRIEELEFRTATGIRKQFVLQAGAQGLKKSFTFDDPVKCMTEACVLISKWQAIMSGMKRDTEQKIRAQKQASKIILPGG